MAEDMHTLESEDIVLVDEDGEEHTFALLDVVEVDGGKYAVLQPVGGDLDEDGEETEAIILKIELDENGEELLSDIEDDEEWEKVADTWQDIVENEADG